MLKGLRAMFSAGERARIRASIQDLVVNSFREPSECKTKNGGHIAWGQFLEPAPEGQHGVYGTSAALQILHRLNEAHPYVEKGCAHMLEQFNDPNSRANRKRDFANTYKYCFFLDALEPSKSEINEPSFAKYCQGLIERQGKSAGWGEYHFSDKDADPPEPLSTCLVLLTLHRLKDFSHSTGAKTALRWLMSQIEAKLNSLKDANYLEQYIILLSLYCAVLQKYVHNQGDLIRPECHKTAVTQLGRTAHRAYSIGVKAQHHFSFGKEEKYIYFEADLILLWALAETGRLLWYPLRSARVLGHYLKRFDRTSGYVPPGFTRKFTVDHLWLLKAIDSVDKVRIAVPWVWVISVFIIAFAAAYFAFQITASVELQQRLVYSLATGIIAGLIVAWLRKKIGWS